MLKVVSVSYIAVVLASQRIWVLYLGSVSGDRAADRDLETHLNIPFSSALAMMRISPRY